MKSSRVCKIGNIIVLLKKLKSNLPYNCNRPGNKAIRTDQKKPKIPMITFSNASFKPWTMMIEFSNTSITFFTMTTPKRLIYFTIVTIP